MNIKNRYSSINPSDLLILESSMDIISKKYLNIFHIHSDMNNFNTFNIEHMVQIDSLPQLGKIIRNDKKKLELYNFELIEQTDTISLIMMYTEKN